MRGWDISKYRIETDNGEIFLGERVDLSVLLKRSFLANRISINIDMKAMEQIGFDPLCGLLEKTSLEPRR